MQINELINSPEFLRMMLISLLLNLLILFLTATLFKNVIKEVASHNRKIKPLASYLLMIPIFNLFFIFYLIHKTFQSLFLEFEARNQPTKYLNTVYNIGMVYGISSILAVVPQLSEIFGFVMIVLFIVFLMQMSKLRLILKNNKPQNF